MQFFNSTFKKKPQKTSTHVLLDIYWKVTKNTVQDTDPFNILMKTSIGDQTLKYFIMILLKGPDNPYSSSNSMIHINSNNMDATTPLSFGSWAQV